MKNKIIFAFVGILLSAGVSNAQATQDCQVKASLAYDQAKSKNYDAAYPQIMKVIEECPKYSLATFQYAEIILEYKINKAADGPKEQYVQELIDVLKQRMEYFPAKTQKGKTFSQIGQLMYDYNVGSKKEQYAMFDKAFTEDAEHFTSAKSLITYFYLLIDLQDAGEATLQDVFEKYDDVSAKIEEEENALAENVAPLLKKQESGQALTAKEETLLKNSEINLKAYSQVRGAINGKLGQRADCENLIPLYNGEFDAKKGDVEWLRRAAGRLSSKECTEDPLFFKLVEALHTAEPSAKTARYLGELAENDGNSSKALEYFNQSAELETNPSDKAAVYYKIANNYKAKGSFGQAKNFYNKALQAKPSMGRAYLQIAAMIASSANDCGTTSFEKRAVYWLAADYAARAGRVNPSLQSTANQTVASYKGRAPQRSDIFQENMQGKTVRIGCWINDSVVVPTL
ncbi:MAG TPA: hypothetical protein VFM70_05945 [Salinimicrobium sp.]|nr:hypothetical protein [Salinimicrobium sp.]